MEKKFEKIDLKLTNIDADNGYCGSFLSRRKYRYTFESDHYLPLVYNDLYAERDIPCTISEFKEVNEICEIELVEWLNENFK